MRKSLAVVAFALGFVLPGVPLAQTMEQDLAALLEAVQWEKQVEGANRLMRAAFIQGMRNRSAQNPALAKMLEQEYDVTFSSCAMVSAAITAEDLRSDGYFATAASMRLSDSRERTRGAFTGRPPRTRCPWCR